MRRITATITFLLLLASVPAAPAAGTTPDRPIGDPYLAATADAEARMRVEGVPSPLREHLARFEAGLTQHRGEGGPTFVRLDHDPEETSFVHAIPVNDVTGDGYEDVASFEYARPGNLGNGGGTFVVSRQGATGALVREMRLDDPPAPAAAGARWSLRFAAAGDLAGNGGAQVLVIDLVATAPWWGSWPPASYAVQQEIEVFDLATGERLWSFDEDGSLVTAGMGNASVTSMRDLWSRAGWVGGQDVNVFLASCDAFVEPSGQASEATCTAERRAMLTGATIASATVPVPYAGAPLWTAGDLDGDGSDDLAVIAPGGGSTAVTALSWADGSEIWERVLPGEYEDGYAWPARLSAPARDDLILLRYRFARYGEHFSVQVAYDALAGNDGAVLWSHGSAGESWRSVMPDVDGDGMSEILERTDREDGFDTTMLDGATLAPFWARTFTHGQGKHISGCCAGDFDGDGYQDLAVELVDRVTDTPISLEAVSLRTGETLWTTSDAPGPAQGWWFDLNGNGTDDLLFDIGTAEQVSFEIRDGLTLTPLRTTPPLAWASMYVDVTMLDATSAGTAELLLQGRGSGGDVIAVQGAATLWEQRFGS